MYHHGRRSTLSFVDTARRYRQSPFLRALDGLAAGLDRSVGWPRLPVPFGLFVLDGLRNILRRDNLFDTTGYPSADLPPLPPPAVEHRTTRSVDGSYNDLRHPRMGMAGSRFGRNVAPEQGRPEPPELIMSPSPREVSRVALSRREFQGAGSINALAAAWLQFMIRDWLHHNRGTVADAWQVPLAEGDDWPEPALLIPRTPADATRPAGSDAPPTFLNESSHWWDASQIYGTTAAAQQLLRTHQGGKLKQPEELLTMIGADTGLFDLDGFWVGIALLHILFIREHNAICEHLLSEYPGTDDETLFQRARLINAALIAKIHTLEWTPAVIDRPTTRKGMWANWYGLQGRWLTRRLGRLINNDEISGIVGGGTDHYGVPFAVTEEFAAVYRMHPLLPDDWTFRAAADGAELGHADFEQLAGLRAVGVLNKYSLADLFYSFGAAQAGALTLHNYPRFLQKFQRPNGTLIDLAATDVLRTRELGVPRYNAFRRSLRLRPAPSIEALTGNPAWAAELGELYGGDVERVDLLVGLLAEERPAGFAFGETAFRIFLLMAARRLSSDRFLTEDFRPEVYTPAGMRWIDRNTMVTVLRRHLPELGRITDAFKPFE